MKLFFLLPKVQKKNKCNYFQFFKNPVTSYNDSGECILDEAQKRHYSFKCLCFKMTTFLDFEVTANKSAVIFLKRQQFVKREERKRNSNSIGRINFEQ